MTPLRILSAADVERALPVRDAIDAMKRAYAALSSDHVDMPLRGRVSADDKGVVLTMPAYLSDDADLAVKLVSIFPDNVKHKLPIIHALVLAFDAKTGVPLALMEGRTLTAIRTGAGAGAAADVLANPDASTLAIIGSGVQARSGLTAICEVRNITRVYIYSPSSFGAERFAMEMGGRGRVPKAITVVSDPNDAVYAADIVHTATTSKTPVFDGSALKRGVHVSAVGSYTPDMQEVDETTITRAFVTVDSREACLAEAGDLIIPLHNGVITADHIRAEIGAILNGTAEGRTSPDQITYFKSVGIAAQDAAAAGVILRNAAALDLGTLADL